ncbi:hypothetical protein [Photobacterium kagoshimensis]|uniref:hypothetical protein n=1 Tax=Photobacterium kagoshimensis TaxID=2910242 RepID=UPI003D0EAA07
MLLEKLLDSDLLELTQEYNNLYIEMLFLTENGERVKLYASNRNSLPLDIKFQVLSLSAKKTTLHELPTLGEVEGISWKDGVLLVEGDFGVIRVDTDRVTLESGL